MISGSTTKISINKALLLESDVALKNLSSSREVRCEKDGLSCLVESYLELSQSKTAAGADLAVVLDGRASDNRAELVDGTGSQSSGLGLTGSTAGSLLASLLIPIMSITIFPVI